MALKDIFKPKWQHSNSDVRKEAIPNLTDQKVLADVVKNDKSEKVRKVAIEKITDQKVLADIAKNDTDSRIREGAQDKLSEDN